MVKYGGFAVILYYFEILKKLKKLSICEILYMFNVIKIGKNDCLPLPATYLHEFHIFDSVSVFIINTECVIFNMYMLKIDLEVYMFTKQ